MTILQSESLLEGGAELEMQHLRVGIRSSCDVNHDVCQILWEVMLG